ncbi:RBBP9/YdeN family alpha/beta hydrolase [Acinetobacter sp. MD2(2019)]|uniref:RBBP9/YdeN family alpha/beta hydrolase n=1 Tax=Acinetobacter sp. MD2(2019) TaxID=2605273 RepID=UPI002D1F0339|nr:alpha/beta fold hydrolase [Acinetobacter sp. MD2(2019)]MEB3754385.1 alpha/beta fold hydrolase [Acinetobacter sp. MD2(2019)]
MTHHLIVPGVGGSDAEHWQSWLQTQIKQSSRVEQDWDRPILSEWVSNWVKAVQNIDAPIKVIAHSFGCLTSLAALAQHPELTSKISKLILVAPANPNRFDESGFAKIGQANYQHVFKTMNMTVESVMLISENDSWLGLDDAMVWAKCWNIPSVNLGSVGHINVASGFGPFPQILPYLNL